jgi:predicted amidohydrolase YtcJ
MKPNFSDPLIKIKGKKFYADGSIQLGTAYLRDKYGNGYEQNGTGCPNYTKEALSK